MPASEDILRSIEDHLRQIEEETAALTAALQALEGESGAASPASRRAGGRPRRAASRPRRSSERSSEPSSEPETAPRRRRSPRAPARRSGANGAAATADAGAAEKTDAGGSAGEPGPPAVVSGGDAVVVEVGSVGAEPDASGPVREPVETNAGEAETGPDATSPAQGETSGADAEPAPRRSRREALSAERVAEILAESDEGLSAIAIAKRASASANRVLSLLRELQAAGRARAEGTRRTSRWTATRGD